MYTYSRHNEDGSYTYGYEAADGTFKLETRFPDGAVQGKYGYVDVNGEVKIIEYGANAMGFQPTGDLPEGIIIPPPVEGNCTDCNYDYDDYEERPQGQNEDDRSRTTIVNRARTGQPSRGAPQPPTQNRGQTLNQPITPAPLPRRPEPAFRPAPPQQQQKQFSAFPPQAPAPQQQQQFPGFPAAAPAQQFIPTRAPQRQAQRQPAARPAVARPAPSRQAPARPAPSRQATPQPSSFRPTPQAPAAPRPAPVRSSSSSSSSGSFANFPARENPNRGRSRPGSSSPSRSQASVPAAPSRQSAPLRASPSRSAAPSRGASLVANSAPRRQPAQPSPIRPAFEDPAVQSAPRFTSFQAQPLPQRPAAPRAPQQPLRQTSRPALTFADATPAVPAAAAPANLPASALEIVDFNQLVQEFQGSQRGQGRQLQQQQQSFPAQRFSTDNFPIRY